MHSTLTLYGALTLFLAMLVLAFVPGVSVLAVTARSAASGFVQGVFTVLGIVLGDIVYIVIAIYGLSLVADMLGSHFYLIKYLGGAYLIWFGIELWSSRSRTRRMERGEAPSSMSSFMSGLLITLGDQKAILFYLGFIPAFLDLATVTFIDTMLIIVIASVAVGGAKLVYAYAADRAVNLFTRAGTGINIVAGSVMAFIGVSIIAMA